MILTIYVEIDEKFNQSIAAKTQDILSTLWLVERVPAICASIPVDHKSILDVKRFYEMQDRIVLDNINRAGVKPIVA